MRTGSRFGLVGNRSGLAGRARRFSPLLEAAGLSRCLYLDDGQLDDCRTEKQVASNGAKTWTEWG